MLKLRNQSGTIAFQDRNYFDDRLFVLYLCKGKIVEEPDGVIVTTIYHEQAPLEYIWCVVTYRNCTRYPAYRVDSFHKKEAAVAYIKAVEPETPLISLGGKSPDPKPTYEEYQEWKQKNGLKEYQWKEMYALLGPNGNANEHMFESKDHFKGIK